ncbi:MAG: hypothetical protein A3A80_04445 [Candidatus Terrybacteria bacterium RIFCSPLOWO2_01_FULL_44_24]|uniref:Amidohydrolase 3 domain-containing protein n=1 Tax=Candidatus Terrybacteria bacterium RIFCSPHIGHO2_01_FULL_43_35 TaxID=1802361 RepID=A0A1G2PC40_9BACT|nr:MAG: hypothetical protein A2828_01320 [Candidatus Terrybacteria bacterium RIFCSPHIGHO2_01_FULL_43_35]OHA51335.1 MAG: hypothetical protein A3A80_04445 [Candidatus Terrybacteria bacterium RIFCSPLOWO2_01_FULL_44_24]
MDILIKNGTVLDGTNTPAKQTDIAISNGKIEGVGSFADIKAGDIIDAQGLFVAPGFVDIVNHSDAYLTILKTPSSESLLRQGITTALLGNCGSSLAPLIRGELITSVQKWGDISGVNINWERFSEYLDALSGFNLGINFASLVGHATLRRGFLDHSMEEAGEANIKKMSRLLSDALDEGAFGLSFAPAYLHGRPAGKNELLPLVKMVAERKGLFSVHLRDEGEKILDSINEVLDLVKETGVKTEIAHLKVSGPSSWHLAKQVIELIDEAIKKDLPVHFDVYPYLRSYIVLYLLFPHWAQEGGRRVMLNRLKENKERAKIIEEMDNGPYKELLGTIRIGTVHRDKTFAGKKIAEIASNQGVSYAEALCNVMVANEGRVSIFMADISKINLQGFFAHQASFIATAGAGYDMSWSSTNEFPHPRSFGAFPRALAIGARKWNMPWENLISKMTSEPAEHIGLSDRGKLMPGFMADVVIFDPKTIASRSRFKNPFKYPVGIKYVLVNGKIALNPKGLSGVYAGRVIKRKG